MSHLIPKPFADEVIPVSVDDDVEFQQLVDKLLAEFPQVNSPGFDFSKIRGTLNQRTGKALVLHLTLSGWSITQIAAALDVEPSRVSNQLVRAISESAPLDDIELLRQLELQRLGEMEKMIREQFVRSCQNKVVKTVSDGDGEGHGEMLVTRTEGQSGNPAYMRILVEISKRRAALLGLDASTKVSIDKTSREMVIHEVVVNTREDAIALKNAGLLKQ
jgi:hypothetical protein